MKTNHTIEILDCIKGGMSETVTYLADNVEVSVTGEFYTDKKGNRHHVHEFTDGVEIDVIF